MERLVTVGKKSFEGISSKDHFYVDKTMFLKEWWERDEEVTLITRPRRFGKTLTMNMVERFFSLKYENMPEPFENLEIGRDEEMMKLQGTIPVISLTFMSTNGENFHEMLKKITLHLMVVCNEYKSILKSDSTDALACEFIEKFLDNRYDEEGDIKPASTVMLSNVLKMLCMALNSYYGKNVCILLDEYDTPLQSAYLNGYWSQAAKFFDSLFKGTFKENDYLDKALITGISRVANESLFSSFNNPVICSVTFPLYEEAFGFTQKEVDDALVEYGLAGQKDEIKRWYDGYQFGGRDGMYSPWNIANFLFYKEIDSYWVNSASNEIVSHWIKRGSIELKDKFIDLLQGRSIVTSVNEETTCMSLLAREDTVWGLLLACGYLKCLKREGKQYTLAIVNHEVMEMMDEIVHAWFRTEKDQRSYDSFVNALFALDEGRMNASLSALAKEIFGLMDTSGNEGEHDPEDFCHGFVLGLVVSLRDRYVIESNRDSGYGRFDIMLIPLNKDDNGIILEFKVFNKEKEDSLEGTCTRALQQIEEKQYDVELRKHGVREEKIHKFGIGFKRKENLVKKYKGKESLVMPVKKPRKARAKRRQSAKRKLVWVLSPPECI